MVGDSKTDIETAKNASMPVVAVNFGYTDLPVETYRAGPRHLRISTNFGMLPKAWSRRAEVAARIGLD